MEQPRIAPGRFLMNTCAEHASKSYIFCLSRKREGSHERHRTEGFLRAEPAGFREAG
jgi:hypothetical protein